MSIINQLLGGTEKAKIVIQKSLTVPQASLINSNLLKSVTGTMAEKAKQLQGGLVNAHGETSVTVQYNPSSLSIQTRAGDVPIRSMQNENDANSLVVQNTFPTSTMLSVDLIFDRENNFDAFLSEKIPVSIDKAVQMGSALIRKDLSVTPYINAFLGMILDRRTRGIVFNWGNMSFSGDLVSVNSKMTMFSTSGKAIRGVVSLKIQQVEKGYETVWNDAFNKFVSEKTDKFQMKNSLKQIGGSLFNTNII